MLDKERVGKRRKRLIGSGGILSSSSSNSTTLSLSTLSPLKDYAPYVFGSKDDKFAAIQSKHCMKCLEAFNRLTTASGNNSNNKLVLQ